ncbi:hypothetical protein [Alloacidobacterium sp.]|uniref:hypothetical protein n=1 Tax=Alloacidobacterium sp. TaxID=2951999 RepID=UPI002D3C4E4C|nr:hypothetical protein [Alloacidobacterium sp.]HYK37450.1 hypothetical protein [Alloacidobacterium sp.]
MASLSARHESPGTPGYIQLHDSLVLPTLQALVADQICDTSFACATKWRSDLALVKVSGLAPSVIKRNPKTVWAAIDRQRSIRPYPLTTADPGNQHQMKLREQ